MPPVSNKKIIFRLMSGVGDSNPSPPRISLSLDKTKQKQEPVPLRQSRVPIFGSDSSKAKVVAAPTISSVNVHQPTMTFPSVDRRSIIPSITLRPLNPDVYGLQLRVTVEGELVTRPLINPVSPCTTLSSISSIKMPPEYALKQALDKLTDPMDEDLTVEQFETRLSVEDCDSSASSASLTCSTLGNSPITSLIAAPIKFISRPERLGLGAESSFSINPTKHYMSIDERHVHRQLEGQRVRIIQGMHVGLTGVIIRVSNDNQMFVCIALDLNGELMELPLSSLAEEISTSIKVSNSNEISVWKPTLFNWLPYPGLLVRFIDRNWQSGKYYNKRGIIQDVVNEPLSDVPLVQITLQSDRRITLNSVPLYVIAPIQASVGRPAMLITPGYQINPGTRVRIIEHIEVQERCTGFIVADYSMIHIITVRAEDLSECI